MTKNKSSNTDEKLDLGYPRFRGDIGAMGEEQTVPPNPKSVAEPLHTYILHAYISHTYIHAHIT